MRVGVFDRHSGAGECTVDICPLGRVHGAFLMSKFGSCAATCRLRDDRHFEHK